MTANKEELKTRGTYSQVLTTLVTDKDKAVARHDHQYYISYDLNSFK